MFLPWALEPRACSAHGEHAPGDPANRPGLPGKDRVVSAKVETSEHGLAAEPRAASAGRALADGFHEVPPGKIACVVTSLEMLAPPLVAPEPHGLDLRRAERPASHTYRRLFRAVGTPWLWTSRLLLDDASLARILHDPAVEVWVLHREGGEAGLVELDFRVAGECELTFFGLVPGLTGQGIGPRLMAHAMRRAWARPIGRFWVHTCTLDHPAAVGFYRKAGFVPFRCEVEVGDDPRLTGLIAAV